MRNLLVVALVLCFSASALAEEKARVLLMNLKTAGVDENTANLIGDLMAVKLSKNPQIEVVNSGDIKRMMELESDKARAGCDDDSCLADLAGALGARYVIYGTLGKLGSRYVTTLNLFDAELGKAINRADVQAESMDVVSDRLDFALHDLVAPMTLANDFKIDKQNRSADSGESPPLAPAPTSTPLGLFLAGGGGVVFLLSYLPSLFLIGVEPVVAIPVAGPLFLPFIPSATGMSNLSSAPICCACSAVQGAGLALLIGGLFWPSESESENPPQKSNTERVFRGTPSAPALSMAY